MQLQGTLELQKVSKVKSGHRFDCTMASGASLWAWLLLGMLLTPGAQSLLSEDEEEMLVELHNYYRGQVSPSASAMLPLKWDPMLKLMAEGYAAKCIWNHNPDLMDIGENLYAGTGPLDLSVALEKWFLEHLNFDFHNNRCDEDKMCGHYTQMVWSDTHRVGCAAHLCDNMEGLAWEKISFLVCNYYPAGNYEDERPYVEGDSCSKCPEKLQTCENNLCAPGLDDDDSGEEQGEEGMLFFSAATTESFHQAVMTSRTSRNTPPPLTPLVTSKPNFTYGEKEEEDLLVLTLTTTESYHEVSIITTASRTPPLPLTTTLPPPLVTPKPNLHSGEEEEEKEGALALAKTELYHQTDISSRTVPTALTPTPEQWKAAMKNGEDSKAGQQKTRKKGLPLITISQKEILVSDGSSLPSAPLNIVASLSFSFFTLIVLSL